ncbi:hypothetical protein KIS4809_2060 [Bacillus sp. ZZV12-4809]|nr:hypothetical protein KIS4809_2060 [Bacillus sp. ZZV12-4809]
MVFEKYVAYFSKLYRMLSFCLFLFTVYFESVSFYRKDFSVT